MKSDDEFYLSEIQILNQNFKKKLQKNETGNTFELKKKCLDLGAPIK